MEPRDRIVEAAARLLAEGGREAVSTRAVGAAAGVQAPTIYRLFGDKQGLLDAVAERGFAAYVGPKVGPGVGSGGGSGGDAADDDPVAELRRGWDVHLEFGLANPALYVLMNEPRPGGPPPVAEAGIDHLRSLVQRIAEAGRLAVPVEQAVLLIHASGMGATLTILATPVTPGAARDTSVSVLAREATIAAITTEATAVAPGAAAAAVSLSASLADVDQLSAAEKALLGDWLDRIATPSPEG